jgi:hypothetical protein
MFRSIAVAAAVAVASPAAFAQSNQMPGLMAKISASDVVSMMTELGVATQLVPIQGTGPVVLATTPGGGKFVFHLMACDDVANSARCGNVIVTAAMSNTGLAYDDLNAFNGDSIVTAAVNVPEEQVVVLGRNIVVVGGHSRELFKTTVYLFLNDVQKFAASSASSKSVGFTVAPNPQSKIDALSAGKRPARAFGFDDLSADVSASIANTKDVDFSLPKQP